MTPDTLFSLLLQTAMALLLAPAVFPGLRRRFRSYRWLVIACYGAALLGAVIEALAWLFR